MFSDINGIVSSKSNCVEIQDSLEKAQQSGKNLRVYVKDEGNYHHETRPDLSHILG